MATHQGVTTPATIPLLICMAITITLPAPASASRTILEKTYQHTISTWETITCNKCWPGHYFLQHCTNDLRNASCTECPPGRFQPSYSIANSCASCRSCLSQREVVFRNCSTTRDTECRCQPGHYKKTEGSNEGVCLAHKVCPKGEGVRYEGNHVNNTVCESCKLGFTFSPNQSRTQRCQPCHTCSEDYQVLEECTLVSDTQCKMKVKEDQGLSSSAVAGIVSGVVIVLILFLIMAVLCARREQGPRVTQNLYKKYCSRNGTSKKPVTNGYKYTAQGAGDEVDKDLSERELKLMQIFPDFSRDLIHPEWKFFFRYLFEDSDKYIHEAELNYQGNVREQIHSILREWVKRDKEKATPERLIEALQQLERKDLIQKYFSPTPTTDSSDTRMTEV